MTAKNINKENKIKIINNEIYTNLLMKEFTDLEEKLDSSEDAILNFEMSDRVLIVDEKNCDEKDKNMCKEKNKEIRLGMRFLKYNHFSLTQKKEIIQILKCEDILLEVVSEQIQEKIKIQEQALLKSKSMMEMIKKLDE